MTKKCIHCTKTLITKEIGAWGKHDEVAIIKGGTVMRLKIKRDLGLNNYCICVSCRKDEDSEMIWDFRCSGCQMQCQKSHPGEEVSGGFGFKDKDGSEKTIHIATNHEDGTDDDGHISSFYGSSYDCNVYKVSEEWKQRIKIPGFNICDDCIDYYCEKGEFELISSDDSW